LLWLVEKKIQPPNIAVVIDHSNSTFFSRPTIATY
jgi:hypothetical protein